MRLETKKLRERLLPGYKHKPIQDLRHSNPHPESSMVEVGLEVEVVGVVGVVDLEVVEATLLEVEAVEVLEVGVVGQQ